ncbi:MAG: mandelate racemase/muconate lactonizing enzyme family protein [Kiritimatiellae bacterium]|nr:mandelate racemase/muconate lactonizing enzyme family protein [Kiritimatiellia bacterium]
MANINSVNPSSLKITDMRFADIDGAPKRCTLLKLYTNQGLVGYGEVRDASSRTYAAMLKSRILGENPCNVEKIFRRIKQFGGDSRQAGGVCAIELACWDICGKAWGVPVWQLLGGKWRDEIRCYCDTDSEGGGRDMGKALKERMAMGFTFLKMDLGIELLMDVPGTLIAPLGYLDYMKKMKHVVQTPHGSIDPRSMRGDAYDLFNTAHGFTGIHITEKGLDHLEKYMADVREVVGWEVPIAIDHLGHIPYEDAVQLLRRLEKYHLSWAEDILPWRNTEQWKQLHAATTTPLGTGEDIYLKEDFKPLLESHALAVVHPDLLTCGGMMETKKVGDMAEDYGVQMNIHMAESPVTCLAAAHVAAATRNFMALELHSVDVPWWSDLVMPSLSYEGGFIKVPDQPGLGIDELNEKLIKEHACPDFPEPWNPTEEWNKEWANDRRWS